MARPGDEVAHVVEVAGDRGALGLTLLVAESLEQLAGIPSDDLGVAEAVLGVAELAKVVVGQPDEGLHRWVGLHLGQADHQRGSAAGRGGFYYFERHNLLCIVSSSSSLKTCGIGC